MLVEPLDSKGDCVGFYCNGQIVKEVPDHVESWAYHPAFGANGEYAYLYCQDEINKFVSDDYKSDWKMLNNKMKAFFKSFGSAKSFNNACLNSIILSVKTHSEIDKFIFIIVD